MSAAGSSDPVPNLSASASKSKKKSKKKRGAGSKPDGNHSAVVNGNGAAAASEVDVGDETEPELLTKTIANDTSTDDDDDVDDLPDPSDPISPLSNGNGARNFISSAVAVGIARSRSNQSITPPILASNTDERLEALVKERDSLRIEVIELRKSLENIQEKHEEEITGLQGQLEDSQTGKEHFETQYRSLLGRVNGIKASLGDRLKADAEKLEQARSQIEDLEEQNHGLQETNEALAADISRLRKESESQASEIANLRSRANLSQQNWIKERDELIQREAFAREEFENAKQAMQDWEVLAMDERSLRETLGDRVTELEEQLSAQREAYEKAASERDSQSLTVDGLQRALQDIQDARKRELRELVEHSQSQLEELRKQLQAAEEASSSSKAALEATQKELERASPFEKEVKEKNLLIGKLRHEAVTLNDHLTKALRILKKGKPEDNVDRQIVTNYLLHFLAIDRSDPKKFEALQLIAALLNWNDEQREQAGLARPGASNNSLRIPLSPFRRTPSTPSLNTDHLNATNSGNSKESLAELWSNFLEHEAAQEGANSRRDSRATPPTSAGGVDAKSRSDAGLGITESK